MIAVNQTPEQTAHHKDNYAFWLKGWQVPSKNQINLACLPDVSVRACQTDIGPADFFLFAHIVLMPGCYFGNKEGKDDGALFTDKIAALKTRLAEQLSKGHSFETENRENLKSIGNEFLSNTQCN